jgi:hypothetical protein
VCPARTLKLAARPDAVGAAFLGATRLGLAVPDMLVPIAALR